jgi:phosphopentomutase
MLTGYDVPTHQINSNEPYKVQGAYMQTKSIFQYAKDQGLFTALITGKKQLIYFVQPGALDIVKVYKRAKDDEVANYATNIISNNNFDMMLISFGNTDITGHEVGWMSEQYLRAVSRADDATRQVYAELQRMYLLETTLIVITADHGGEGDFHGMNRPQDETIPWIIVGPCVKKGFELPVEPRLRIMDTAPTILWALGLSLPPDIEGRVIYEAFESNAFPLAVLPALTPSYEAAWMEKIRRVDPTGKMYVPAELTPGEAALSPH